MEIKMTFPHRLKFALFFICCMQHVYASNSSVTVSKSSMSAVADSSMMTQADSSTTVVATTSAMSSGYDIASTGGANTTGTPMAATTNVSYTSKASATTIVPPTSTTHDTTTSPSAYVNNASAHVLISSSMFTAPNVTISIRDEYSSPDCKSCSNGGTITVTKLCDIKMPSNVPQKCDKDKFNKTRCSSVTLADKTYRCAEVLKNYTNHVEKKLKIVKECNKECPASGSVLSPHLAFIFATGLVVGMLSQTL